MADKWPLFDAHLWALFMLNQWFQLNQKHWFNQQEKCPQTSWKRLQISGKISTLRHSNHIYSTFGLWLIALLTFISLIDIVAELFSSAVIYISSTRLIAVFKLEIIPCPQFKSVHNKDDKIHVCYISPLDICCWILMMKRGI